MAGRALICQPSIVTSSSLLFFLKPLLPCIPWFSPTFKLDTDRLDGICRNGLQTFSFVPYR